MFKNLFTLSFGWNGTIKSFSDFKEETGRKLEKEVNEQGPGESYFVSCDVRKEKDLKVRNI